MDCLRSKRIADITGSPHVMNFLKHDEEVILLFALKLIFSDISRIRFSEKLVINSKNCRLLIL